MVATTTAPAVDATDSRDGCMSANGERWRGTPTRALTAMVLSPPVQAVP